MQKRDNSEGEDGFADVEEDVYDANPLGVRLCADPADDRGCYAVAEVDADEDRIDPFESQLSGG